MSKSLKGKIGKLENNMLQKPIPGTTLINPWDWPEAEQRVIEQSFKQAELGLSWEDATAKQRAVALKAGEIINFRVFDMFLNYLEVWCQDDSHARQRLHTRFLWFIQNLRKEIDQELEVAEIERNTPEDCEVDRVDEYYRKAPKLFTEESWHTLQEEIDREWIEHLKKTGKWDDFVKQVKKID